MELKQCVYSTNIVTNTSPQCRTNHSHTRTHTLTHTHTHEAHHHTALLIGQCSAGCQYCTVESIATFIAILFDPYYCNPQFEHFFLDTFSPIANFYHDSPNLLLLPKSFADSKTAEYFEMTVFLRPAK